MAPKGISIERAVVLITVWLCFALTSTKGHTGMNVKEPTDKTEFEVQAYLWNELVKRGINARGEVKARYAKRAYVRFDIAIFKDGVLKHIIEIKRSKINHKTRWEDTRQGKRYNEFGVPVNIIYGIDDADAFLGVIDNKFPAMMGNDRESTTSEGTWK